MNVKLYVRLISLTAIVGMFTLTVSGFESKVSDERYKKIRGILKKFRRDGYDFHNKNTVYKVYDEIDKAMPLEPVEKIQKRTVKELTELGKKAIEKKYPHSVEEFRDVAEKKAAEKYKLAQPREEVTISYRKADRTYTLTGPFYYQKRSTVKVGLKSVSMVDLTPQCRAMFDKYYNQRLRKEYVDKQVLRYLEDKSNYSITVVKQMHEDQQKANEDAGYIYVAGEWKTAKEVSDALIKKIQAETKPRVVADTTPKKVDPKPNLEAKTGETSGNGTVSQTDASPDTTGQKDELYQKMKAQAEKELNKICSKFAGVDSDQGYKLGIFGMQKKAVRIVLRDELTEAGHGSEMDTISFSSGPIKTLELYYYHDVFFKIKVTFRIMPLQAMAEIANKMKERYGRTDEEKQELLKTPEQKKKEAEEKMKQAKDKKGPPKMNPVQVVHWTGNVVKALLHAKINSSQTGYEEFYLVRENPDLKDKVDLQLKRQKLAEQNKTMNKNMKDFNKKIHKIDF